MLHIYVVVPVKLQTTFSGRGSRHVSPAEGAI